MDALGAAVALILLSPVFLLLAVLVKLTSKGPVFFRQQRVGRYGVPFEFLKFRSMYVSTDAAIHKEYVKKFIAGKATPAGSKPGHESNLQNHQRSARHLDRQNHATHQPG